MNSFHYGQKCIYVGSFSLFSECTRHLKSLTTPQIQPCSSSTCSNGSASDTNKYLSLFGFKFRVLGLEKQSLHVQGVEQMAVWNEC